MPSDDLIVDLTNFKDRVGSRVAPGTYNVVVEDAESDTARSGNPMVNLWLRIQGGEYDGATIVDRLVMTEKSLFRVVGFMQAIGLPTPKKRLKLNVRGFIGKTLDIEVDDGEPYNGRVKSEVRAYARPAGSKTASVGGGADLDDVDTDDEEPAEEPTEAPEPEPKKKAKAPEPEPESDDDDDAIDIEDVDLS